MTYEEFLEFVPAKCMYETIYDDSEGRTILVVSMLDAYGMANKAALAQQEPWCMKMNGCKTKCEDCPVEVTQEEHMKDEDDDIQVYQRPWVGLTNNELQPIADEYRILFGSWVEDFARAIEAKLKEKNT